MKLTRKKALAQQHKLFPGNHSLANSPPPTLPEICLGLRASVSGQSDPWRNDFLKKTIKMLQHRLNTWEPSMSTECFEDMDNGVKQMVQAAIYIGQYHLRSNPAKETCPRIWKEV